MNAFRVPLLIILTVITSALMFAGIAGAQEVRTSNLVTVPKDSVVDKTVFYAGQDIVIDGTVNGDVFCGGQNIAINGTVNGDVFCAAQNLRLAGTINGSARLAGQNVTISGEIMGNVSIAASTIVLEETALASQDVQLGSDSIAIRGVIARDAAISASSIVITGSVGRNVQSNNESLVLSETAIIGGDLSYRSNNDAVVPEGTVEGQVTKKVPPQTKPVDAVMSFVLGYGYWFAALMLISFVVLGLFPKQLAISYKSTNERPWRTLFVGLFTLVFAPLAITIIGLTLIGIPLAFILMLIFILALAMSGPFFAYFVGTKFMPEQRPWIRMLLGSTIILISYALPVIGILVAIVVAVFGTGMFAEVIMERLPKDFGKSKSKAK